MLVGQGKYRKSASKRNYIDREYHVQDHYDVSHIEVRMCCEANKFPALPFCASNPKPRDARGLSKNYHLQFYPELVHGVGAIFRIPCSCVLCT